MSERIPSKPARRGPLTRRQMVAPVAALALVAAGGVGAAIDHAVQHDPPARPGYLGQLNDDVLGDGTGKADTTARIGDWDVTASSLHTDASGSGSDHCSSVTVQNRSDRDADYQARNWELRTPSQNVQYPTFTDGRLPSRTVKAGAALLDQVCFENTEDTDGTYVLAWTPVLNPDRPKHRMVWLLDGQ